MRIGTIAVGQLAKVISIGITASILASGLARAAPPFGNAKIISPVPTPPGFPEGIAVRGNRFYVAGPATFGTTGKPASQVLAYDISGGPPVKSYPTMGENLGMEHANSSIAFDGDGRLYVLNTQLGMYRLYPGSGQQEAFSQPFPHLPPCGPLPGSQCSPTPVDAPPIPNDLAFDEAGNAYVTDSTQATIWRIPAEGSPPHEPQIWFQDPRLASEYIGVNGLRLSPDRSKVFVTVTTDLEGDSFVYTLPLVSEPKASDLKVFHKYGPGELPDGIAFGQSGLLYVAIATPSASGVSALAPNGEEKFRLSNPALSPSSPYDSPANIAFNGKGSILLTNHAFATGAVDPSQFSVVEVWVDDKASPLAKPIVP